VRTAPVLDKKGGFIGKIMKSMNFGFTVQFGSGQNWFSWIHMEDLIRIYETAVSDESLTGPVNACSPEPVRFRTLLDHLREYRKAVVIPLPVSLFRLFAKELADELTNSQRIMPAKLHDMQFRFVYGNLKEALKDVFS
jgi:NAD dependent epimerase/dehydratase family enzyme